MAQGPITRWLQLQPLVDDPKTSWVGWSDDLPILFRNLRWLFWGGQRHIDAGRYGPARVARDSSRKIAIKNFLGICINSIAVLSFSLTHLVSWPQAMLMAVGALVGGYFGAKMAVRVGKTWVRRGIVLIGFVIFLCHALAFAELTTAPG